MDWGKGYSASYYLTIVDPASWRDLQIVDIISGSVTKTNESLKESADIELTENLGEAWVRVWVDARQKESGGREAIFTGLLQCPETKWDGIRKSYAAECYSVLKAADDVKLQRGWYVLAEQNGAEQAASLLSIGPAPVSYDDGAPLLTDSIIAEDGETHLTMARKILDAMGWRIRISGDGSIRICPEENEERIVLDPQINDIVETAITDKKDLYSCPNVLQVTCGDQTYTAIDEESVQQRGRQIWATESISTLNDGESISDYTWRRLRELQSPARTVKYNRRFIPDIVPGDPVRINFPQQGIDGIYKVDRQQISLGYNATVSEDAVEIIKDVQIQTVKEFTLVDDTDDPLVTDQNENLIGVIE